MMLLTRLLVIATCLMVIYVEFQWLRAMRLRIDILRDAHAQIRPLVKRLEAFARDLDK